ncbi:MAG TPA: prolyl oligopeptidase family serine peptidase [Solirubrobacteraceae bacterium]|nr:prolyl oligopeptidase family serine peptidase [Solirubrobacteraceae bacterium]
MSDRPFAARPGAERYRRALRFTEDAVAARVSAVTITPHWLDGDRFWFEGAAGQRSLVDPDAGTVEPLATPPAEPSTSPGALRSPDGRWELVRRDGDLTLRACADGSERALTTDAEPWWDYAGTPDTSVTGLTLRRSGTTLAPVGRWSPDCTRILTHRIDQRSVRRLPLVESAPADQTAPILHEVRVPFPGDLARPTAHLLVFDVPGGERHEIAGGPLEVRFFSPIELGWAWWGADRDVVWFLTDDRGVRTLSLHRADLRTGVSEIVIEERAGARAGGDRAGYVEPHPLLPWPSHVRTIRGDTAVVWPSERDGWRHLYLYDLRQRPTADPRQLTTGNWIVRDVVHVDHEWVYFTGLGREPWRDPYLRHLYRVRLDGGDPELLTPEPGDHTIAFSPSGRHVLDTASTIDTAPVHRVRRADGARTREIARADIDALVADGWRPPEPFTVTAADGHTELYGALFVPSDLDPSARYPVVDSIYPGPQLMRTPKSFTIDRNAGPDEWPGAWEAQALAELGFVVVTVDGRGTPLRKRAFHLHSYGRLGDHTLPDHVAALRQLAESRPWIDLDRVGIAGHSAGGAAAVRAVIDHPDVFGAAVAGSGDHDLRRYLAYWAEKYEGPADETDYVEASNIDRADRLERPLLLICGELDDNVHPANTLALLDALQRGGADAELVLLPGQNHDCTTHPEYRRRSWEFLVRHLIG